MGKWFTGKDSQRLELLKYKSISDLKILKSAIITDRSYIESLMNRIEKIPAHGDKTVSFGGQAQRTDLNFYFGEQKQTIEIYNKGFKTPSTGFNSVQEETEKSLVRDIDSLLEPDLKKLIPKIKDLEIPFGVFTLIYKGPSANELGSSLTFNDDHFIIKDQQGNTQTLIIKSAGPKPPLPLDFQIENSLLSSLFPSKFTIFTHETNDGTPLYPNYFQITN